MNWYLENREDSDVVKSTRIRFVRNINNFNFRLKESELQELEEKIKENLYGIGYDLKFLKLKSYNRLLYS